MNLVINKSNCFTVITKLLIQDNLDIHYLLLYISLCDGDKIARLQNKSKCNEFISSNREAITKHVLVLLPRISV